ncbi:MAG TPA: hypothetical protein EYN91_19170 [Candidatus Melainabacteria bacterium]|nr:hypothetical protein [Candidatus Melainabacteria bacterium]HIN66371.1 hypothetical protein [Candidatus Obscuribacterales bacterium]
MEKQTAQKITATVLGLSFGIAALADTSTAIPNDTGAEKRSPTFFKTIMEIAGEQDKNPSKDWFPTGPRKFKSGYGKVANNVKAAFSLDLQNWAREKGESLDNLTDTYIPYKKREEFAMWWWLRHDPNYKKAAPWDKDQWKYEAIIDGTELVWRAGNRATSGYSASMEMGHKGLMAQLIKTEGK